MSSSQYAMAMTRYLLNVSVGRSPSRYSLDRADVCHCMPPASARRSSRTNRLAFIDEVIARGLPRLTPYTITDGDFLRRTSPKSASAVTR